jgi:hypothetical protein
LSLKIVSLYFKLILFNKDFFCRLASANGTKSKMSVKTDSKRKILIALRRYPLPFGFSQKKES